MVLVPGSLPPTLPECRDRHAAAFAEHDGERPGWRGQHHAHRRHAERERRAAAPQRLHRPRRDDRDGQHHDGQHGCRRGHGRRRGDYGHHQVGHEHVQRLGVRVLQQREAERHALLLRTGSGPAEAADRTPDVRRDAGRTDPPAIRLFFFGSYEGYIGRQSQFSFFNVPTAALRNGDFSGAVNANGAQQRIYDPFTGDLATGTGRTQFENNVIPADRINAITKQLQALYPLPNVEGTGPGRPDGQLSDGAPDRDRPAQLRPEDQLEPDARASALGQIQPHERARRRSVHLPDWQRRWRWRRDEGPSHHRRADLVVREVAARSTARSASRSLISSAARPTSGSGMMGLDLGIPGTNDQGRGDPRYAGHAAVQDGLHRAREHADVEPDLPRRGHRLLQHQRHEGRGQSRFQGRVPPGLPAPGQLAARTGQSARRLRLRRQLHADVRHRVADLQHLQHLRGVPARPRRHREQELPVRAVHRARVAACDVRPRPVDGESEAHAGSRPALGVLPDHARAPIGRSRCWTWTRSTS